MSVRAAWAQPPWGDTVLPPTPTGQLPPPIPGDPVTFTYNSQLGAYPWAYPSWAGGYPLLAYPGGGVVIHPDPTTGVMIVTAWWPYATALQLVRLDTAGGRTPVRGAYPIAVTGSTRRNAVTNPSIEISNAGFVPDAGSPTLTQLADAAAPAGGYVLRSTNAGAGSNGVTIPTSLTPAPGGQQVTVGIGLRTSALAATITISIGWADALGGALTTSSIVLTADQRAAVLGQFTRITASVTPPTGAVTPTLKIIATGMPAGGTMDLDALLLEIGTTDGSYFDGGTLGATWAGTTGLSAALLAPVTTVRDGECPLDVLVSYELRFPGITGGRVVSNPDTLVSGRRAWLTHPDNPGYPQRIDLRRKPKRDYPLVQGSFQPLNRTRKVVISAAQRLGGEGTIEFNAVSAAERAALLATFADGSPVLLRSPAEYHYEDQWLALGTLTDDPEDRLAHQDAWLLSAPFITVDPPSVLT